MAQFNRILRFPVRDREIYEIQSTDIIYDIVYGNESDKYLSQEIKNPIIRVDLSKDTAKFYVDSDLISILNYYKGVIIYSAENRSFTKKIPAGFLDVAIRKALYDLAKEYNIKDPKQIRLTVNGQIINDMKDFTFWPSELDEKIYDRHRVNITKEGHEVIEYIKLTSYAYKKYVENDYQLTNDVTLTLTESGLYDSFQDFLKQYK